MEPISDLFINYPVKAVVEIKQISNKEHIKRFIYDLKNFDHFNKKKYLNISYYFLIVFGGLTEGYIKKVLKKSLPDNFFSHLHLKLFQFLKKQRLEKIYLLKKFFIMTRLKKLELVQKKFRLSYITISIKPLLIKIKLLI